MVFDYVVILRNTNRRTIDLMNRLLGIIALAYLIYRSVATNFLSGFTLYGSIISIILIALLFAVYIKRRRKIITAGTFLFVTGIIILFNKNIHLFEALFALGLIILSAIEEKAKSNLEIGFSTQFIMFDNLFKKKYNWSDFNNIILKDNLLTLDFKNNRIYQRETIDEESDCDEDEFNKFCREQLRLANSK
ncbi:MAG: hypothetical protein HYR66_08235 [Sphingobacteriales bacterium]|nr:hypothetical protein [Sphingobacteriales bacterium]MBI3718390.1 hypothetical protein [Sphingobacteriales bacterium]